MTSPIADAIDARAEKLEQRASKGGPHSDTLRHDARVHRVIAQDIRAGVLE